MMRPLGARSREAPVRARGASWGIGTTPSAKGTPPRPLVAGVLLLLVSTASLTSVSAEEDTGGWFDVIYEFLKGPEDAPVDVPLRRKPAPESPDAPSTATPGVSASDPLPPSADPVTEPSLEQQAPVPPAPPVSRTDASEPREVEQPSLASTPTEAPGRLEGAELAHVYRGVQDLIAEIDILREEVGAHDVPPETELIEERAPVHVYVKTLEVLAKVAEAQRRLDMPAVRVGRVPVREIDAADILVNVEHARSELTRIKAHMRIERQITAAPLASGATSSTVYRSLSDASFLLDALRGGALTPDDVYRNAMSVLGEVTLIAAKLEVPMEFGPVEVEGTKQPVDVAQQLLRAIYKVINLQTRLQMDASGAPAMSLVRVTPSENHDAANILLAEVARIKLHLGIEGERNGPPDESGGRGSSEVFALVTLIVRNLDRLSEATRV